MKIDGARVLVIGATGGLGSRVAARLADGGAVLALTGRREDRLAAVARQTGAVWSGVLDLLDVEAAAATVTSAAAALGGLDVVLVASGVALFGPVAGDDEALVEELFAVNVIGPMAVLRAAAPRLSQAGALVVLTAVLADVPTAGMAACSASKAALSAYLTALRRELRRSRINVFDVRPPHLETGLAGRALAGDPPTMPPGHDIEEVVALIVQGLSDGRSELVADLSQGSVALR